MFQGLKDKREEIVAAGVALSAFAASAQHIYHVTEAAGNPSIVAALHPAGIDGLIYIGIRAMQRGNKRAGGFAIAYGAAYSLAFNAASYGGFVMPVWALAACMPLAMFAAFLIVHGGHKVVQAAETITETVEVIREVVKERELLPILDACLVLPTPAPVRIPSIPVQRAALPAPVATTSGRVATWDVEKAVAMVLDGKTNNEIAEVLGVNYKSIQKTARCVQMLKADVDVDEVSRVIPLSRAHVLRVQAAMVDASATA